MVPDEYEIKKEKFGVISFFVVCGEGFERELGCCHMYYI
jgi:hypothetical protein